MLLQDAQPPQTFGTEVCGLRHQDAEVQLGQGDGTDRKGAGDGLDAVRDDDARVENRAFRVALVLGPE